MAEIPLGDAMDKDRRNKFYHPLRPARLPRIFAITSGA
jgi:hypothetical protein